MRIRLWKAKTVSKCKWIYWKFPVKFIMHRQLCTCSFKFIVFKNLWKLIWRDCFIFDSFSRNFWDVIQQFSIQRHLRKWQWKKSCPVLRFIQILIHIFNTHLSDFFQMCLWLLTLIHIRNNSHHFKKDLVPYQKRKMKEKYENWWLSSSEHSKMIV